MSYVGSSKQKRVVRLLAAATLAGSMLSFLIDVGRAYFTLKTPGWNEWADFTIPVDTVPFGLISRLRRWSRTTVQ